MSFVFNSTYGDTKSTYEQATELLIVLSVQFVLSQPISGLR